MSDFAAPGTRTRRGLKRVLGVLAIAGPGLIAANAGNDAGGVLTYASAGARFAFRTLFLMVLVTVALVVVQEMCARLGAYTGKGLGALIREQFPVRASMGAMLLLFIANAASPSASSAASAPRRSSLASPDHSGAARVRPDPRQSPQHSR